MYLGPVVFTLQNGATKIVLAGVIPETLSVVHLQVSIPTTTGVVRGIEPTAPRSSLLQRTRALTQAS